MCVCVCLCYENQMSTWGYWATSKILHSRNILLSCTSATSCLTVGFREQEMNVACICGTLHMCVWWEGSNSVHCGISTINCVWNLSDALFTQTSPHTHPPARISSHPRFRTFLPRLTLFVFRRLLFTLFCSHLFVSLNSFYGDFSQLTFQSILLLFTDLILGGVCKLAFGLCPLSQQIFVYGLFCSYLTADHQRLDACCIVPGRCVCVCVCVCVCAIIFVQWDCIWVDLGDPVVGSPHGTPYG